jgi:uncharacterized protein (TIGR03435 family)
MQITVVRARVLGFCLAAGAATILSAQATSDAKFDVASVKRVDPAKLSGIILPGGVAQPGGRWVTTGATVLQIMRTAYPEYSRTEQITGGPDWVDRDLFEVIAQANGTPPRDQILLMIQNLLADRFKLAVHTESHPLNAYILTLARPDGRLGPGLKKRGVDCSVARTGKGSAAEIASCKQAADPGPNGTIHLHAPDFAINGLPKLIASAVDRPIIDRTGLSGNFDIDLEFALVAGNDVSPAPAIYTALQEQLGLKLEPSRDVIPVLVIDHVEPPTPN